MTAQVVAWLTDDTPARVRDYYAMRGITTLAKPSAPHAMANPLDGTSSPCQSRFVLHWQRAQLTLTDCQQPQQLPFCVDFCKPPWWRGGNNQALRRTALAKALGIKSGLTPPRVLDVTAGWARDGFHAARLGCEVILVEREPAIMVMLDDALWHLQHVHPAIAARMQLSCGDAKTLLATWQQPNPKVREPVDVIVLDPMYPGNALRGQVKKESQLLRALCAPDAATRPLGAACDAFSLEAEALLGLALGAGVARVVVKRPRHAPSLGVTPVHHAIVANVSRFDVYRGS